jgi:hypothetical protein
MRESTDLSHLVEFHPCLFFWELRQLPEQVHVTSDEICLQKIRFSPLQNAIVHPALSTPLRMVAPAVRPHPETT